MRISRLVPVLGLAAFLLVPAASALTFTVTPPADPIPYDKPTTLQVAISGSCQEAIQDGTATKTLVVSPSASFIQATGEDFSWKPEEVCNPDTVSQAASCNGDQACIAMWPNATSFANITLTPTNIAPALTPVDIGLGIQGAPDKGSATFQVQVAHYGSFNVTPDPAIVKAGLGETRVFNFTIEANTNAVSLIMLTVSQDATSGKIEGGDQQIELEPNVALYKEHHAGFFVWTDGGPDAGKPVTKSVQLKYVSAATPWTGDNVTIDVMLHAKNDMSKFAGPQSVSWTFQPLPVTTDKGGNSPGPEFAVLAAAIGGLALVLARRRAA